MKKKLSYLAVVAAFLLLGLAIDIKVHNDAANVSGVQTAAKHENGAHNNKPAETTPAATESDTAEADTSNTGTNLVYAGPTNNRVQPTPAPAGTTGPSTAVLGAVTGGMGGGTSSPTTPTTPTTPTNPTTPVLVAPTVSVTAPTNGATVSGMVTVTVNASDDKAVKSVTFMLDGLTGATSVTAPYSFAWDTTKATNGTHTLTAVATDSDNQSTTSATVTVTVNNAPVTPPTADPTNLISNPSLETATNVTTPDNWSNYAGTNTSTFTYLSTGHTGNHSVQVTTTAWTAGGSDWFHVTVPVTANNTYKYSNWYKSDVDTELDAEVTMSDGTVQYLFLATIPASSDWKEATATFTAPAGATSVTIYQVLAKVGTLTTDDYSLTLNNPAPYSSALVTVTFDDGWANQYTNAFPVMQALGLPATYYIVSGALNSDLYMTDANVVDLYAKGNEIASHTVHHCDLTGSGAIAEDHTICPVPMPAAQLQDELATSQATLNALLGGNVVTNFAYPYGAYNANTISQASNYYVSQRTVVAGYNTKDSLDTTQLKMFEVDSNISNAQVQAWIDTAIAQKSWLILTYHEVSDTPAPGDELYNVTPANFAAQMNYLKSTGVQVVTVKQALVSLQGM